MTSPEVERAVLVCVTLVTRIGVSTLFRSVVKGLGLANLFSILVGVSKA